MSVSRPQGISLLLRRIRAACAPGVIALLCCFGVEEVLAQDPVLEALREQRQRVRTAEVLVEIGLRQVPYGPVDVPVYKYGYRRIVSTLPVVMAPEIAIAPLDPRPARSVEAVVEPEELDEVRLARVAPGEAAIFLDRFLETLWANVAGQTTPLDTMATPEARARLHSTFGPPTRTPVPRAGADGAAVGSPQIQFEYWFVVNDSIPFVVMDRGGPFGRGLLMIGDEERAYANGPIRAYLIERILAADRLMPYIDYFQDEDGSWYITGFDGDEFYVRETTRPRWARRSRGEHRWYDFR